MIKISLRSKIIITSRPPQVHLL